MDKETTKEDLRKRLQEQASRLGLQRIKVTTADPFVDLRERLLLQQQEGYDSSFQEPDVEKRWNPQQMLPGARSILAVAMPYASRMPSHSPQSLPGARRGMVARISWGKDYHRVLGDRLRSLAIWIESQGYRSMVMVDTGPLSDRAVAERAGLGFIGKNTMLITPDAGSWVFLGEIITDMVLSPDEPIESMCGDCTLCLDACPTRAFVGPYRLNSNDCLAQWTQSKQKLREDQMEKIGNRLYGCDTCQIVCPYNRSPYKNISIQDLDPEFQPKREEVKPLLLPLLKLSNRQFAALYGHLSGAWRGKTPWQRNALLGLAHFRDRQAVPVIRHCLMDARVVIRGTAAWALGKIGGPEAHAALQKVRLEERDEWVQICIQKALQCWE